MQMLDDDVNQNLSAGVAADAKVGSDLIRVQAVDNDVGNNSLVLYHILSIRYIKLQSNESEDIGNVFIIGVYRSHGTIYNFCVSFNNYNFFTKCPCHIYVLRYI